MDKRKIIFGDYDTAAHGWTLSGWSLSPPKVKTQYAEIPGGDGSLDLSDVLTDGIPRYHDRTLVARLECSDGNRLEREALIRDAVNRLDGVRANIRLPDDDEHYVNGRVSVARLFNDPAHGAIEMEAICEPWKYRLTETEYSVTAGEEDQALILRNGGRRAVCPIVSVEGDGASVQLSFNDTSISLSAGAYKLPDLLLTQGDHAVSYRGTGTLVIRYREAVLE